jgi:D-glycero-D-manno-heptose 1,7-bisphosphate phosphatase
VPLARPALYVFDADGTLRYTTVPGQECPWRTDEWRLMPNVSAVLRTIDWSDGGAALGIASNQTAVSRGHLTAALSRRMIEDTVRAALGVPPARFAVEICTCAPEPRCGCRKPAPGMLRRLLERFRVPAHDALYVGDLPIDREAAAAASVPFRWAWDFFGWRRDQS